MALYSYGSQEELVAQTVLAGGNSCGPIIVMAIYSYMKTALHRRRYIVMALYV